MREDAQPEQWIPTTVLARTSDSLALTFTPRLQPPEYTTFDRVLEVLWRRKAVFGSFVTAGLLLGFLLSLVRPPVYQAKAVLEVRMANDDYLNRRQLDPTLEPGPLLFEPFLQTQMRLLQSETLLWNAAQETGLDGKAEFKEANSAWGRRWPWSRTVSPRTRVLLLIARRLTVRLAGQAHVIEVLFESRDANLAAEFVNRLVADYRRQSLENLRDSTNGTEALLSARTDELKRSVAAAEKSLRNYVAANGLSSITDKDSVAEARLRQIQTELGTAEDNRIAEQSRYDLARTASPEALSETLESDALKAYRLKLTDLKQELAEANEVMKPTHYRVRQLEAEIKSVEAAFNRERSGILLRLQNQYQTAALRERALQRDYDRQSRIVSEQVSRSIRYNTLKQELDVRRQIYEQALHQVSDAKVNSATYSSNISVVDPAVAPELPYKPSKPLYSALGTVTGTFLGMIFVFAQDRRDRWEQALSTVARPAAIAAAPFNQPKLSLPSLGAIPSITVAMAAQPSPLHRAGERLAEADGDVIQLEETPVPLTLETWRDADPEVAKAFRDLLPRVFLSGESGRGRRTVVVTSSSAGEGRTTVACNLALAAAAAGKTVLLIDGDPVNPRLHEIFNVPNEDGFSEVISRVSAREHPSSRCSIWMTDIHGLHVLPSGRATEDRPSLMDDPRTGRLLDQFRTPFDVVIVDAPSLLTASAIGLGRQADGVALVVRADRASQEVVDSAVQELKKNGAPIIGAILNDCGRGIA